MARLMYVFLYCKSLPCNFNETVIRYFLLVNQIKPELLQSSADTCEMRLNFIYKIQKLMLYKVEGKVSLDNPRVVSL